MLKVFVFMAAEKNGSLVVDVVVVVVRNNVDALIRLPIRHRFDVQMNGHFLTSEIDRSPALIHYINAQSIDHASRHGIVYDRRRSQYHLESRLDVRSERENHMPRFTVHVTPLGDVTFDANRVHR